jgi:hypothetical protein
MTKIMIRVIVIALIYCLIRMGIKKLLERWYKKTASPRKGCSQIKIADYLSLSNFSR